MTRMASSVAKPDGEAIIVKISSPIKEDLSVVMLMERVAKVALGKRKNKKMRRARILIPPV